MKDLKKILFASVIGLLLASTAEANNLTFSGTLLKNSAGTTFDTWNFDIQSTGQFTVDLRAYEASQSSTTAAGYYTQDLNGDGELTWLDPDTSFYKNTGNSLLSTDAIVRCDDTQNNCPVYQNGYTAATSPLVVNSHLQSETSVDGSIHFRRDPWFDVNAATPGSYKYLVADYTLSTTEAQNGINAGDSFSAPTGFSSPILDHADYQVKLSSNTLNFSLTGNTITVSAVPEPEEWAMMLLGMPLMGWVVRRKQSLSQVTEI